MFQDSNIQTAGMADNECTTAKYPAPNDANCRRVDVVITVGECTQ